MKSQPLVLFDLDDTLVRGNMSVRFGLYLLRKKIFPKWRLIRALFIYSLFYLGICSFERMQRIVFSILFKGQKAELVFQEAHTFCSSVYDQVVHSSVYGELEEFIRDRADVVLISSSPDFLVKVFAQKLGIERYFASKYLVNSLGEFTAVEPMNGPGKVKVFSMLPKHDKTIAYSDSYSDVELLKRVDVPVAVHPDRKLYRYAKIHGWRLIEGESACV